jgi:hypothetical protein
MSEPVHFRLHSVTSTALSRDDERSRFGDDEFQDGEGKCT